MSATTIFVHDRMFSVVTIGGGVWDGRRPNSSASHTLRCASCHATYPLAADPLGLALSPAGATVLPGYTEMCPHCYHNHQAGTLLEGA